MVLTPGRDSFSWRLSQSGSYSAASAYEVQFLGAVKTNFKSEIWQIKAPSKCKFFLWLLAKQRLLTADALLARGWPNAYFCQLCHRNLETANHLCFECPWALSIWDSVGLNFNLPCLRPANWSLPCSAFRWFCDMINGQDRHVRSIAVMTLWEIWLERNRRIFQESDMTKGILTQRITESCQLWSFARGAPLMP